MLKMELKFVAIAAQSKKKDYLIQQLNGIITVVEMEQGKIKAELMEK